METLKDKRVLVAGLGKSGVAAARFCASRGARVVAADAKRLEELGESVRALPALGVELVLGGERPAPAADCDLAVASPGVPLDSPLMAEARRRNVPVVGEMELAVSEIDRPILAITGTNGKTTTTALAGHLLNASGMKACVAGNIGTPVIACVEEARAADVVVLEVSSFQLETTPSLSADIGVWLNATEDHVDRHGSFTAYVASKEKLFRQMRSGAFGIYNANDAVVARSVAATDAMLVPFDAEGRDRHFIEGSWGACDGVDLIVRTERGGPHRYPLSEARLAGLHNRENMLAAILAAELAGAAHDRVRRALATFEGLPHRMQLVASPGGVSYYDDSKGTNVGATIRALQGFDGPVVLIAGGLSKGADLAPLAAAAKGRVRRAILIGEAASEMERLFAGGTMTERASSMEDAVRKARAAALPGDAVLLSPACASFDMFRDYAARGDAFQAAVRNLVIDDQSRVTSHE